MLGKISKYLADLENTAFEYIPGHRQTDLSGRKSIYLSTLDVPVRVLLFGGTWARWGNGRVPVGVDTSADRNLTAWKKIGGEKTHRLTEDEMPAHQHFADNNDGEEKLTGERRKHGIFARQQMKGLAIAIRLELGIQEQPDRHGHQNSCSRRRGSAQQPAAVHHLLYVETHSVKEAHMEKLILKDNTEIEIEPGTGISRMVTYVEDYAALGDLAEKLTRENLSAVKIGAEGRYRQRELYGHGLEVTRILKSQTWAAG